MPKGTFRRTSKLAAVAIAAVGAGALAVEAPASAGPGNCEQWGFSGVHNIKLSTGPVLTFDSRRARAQICRLPTTTDPTMGTSALGAVQPNGIHVSRLHQ